MGANEMKTSYSAGTKYLCPNVTVYILGITLELSSTAFSASMASLNSLLGYTMISTCSS
jgi:hypothetical protein